MAWRFKASKYKNAAPIIPKSELLVKGLPIGNYRSQGNCIASSAAFMAFNWDTAGSSLAVLPLDSMGRQNRAQMPLIYAHSDFVTDFQFSPFDDGLLATGSQDLSIKLWRIPESGLTQSGLSNPELSLPLQPRKVDTVNFHPTADCILATSSANGLTLWDLVTAKELYSFMEHGDYVQSVAWQKSGKLVATQSKDCQLRILDPRAPSVTFQCDSHQGMKDSRVVWIGESDRVLTTGFSAEQFREIIIRDIRNIKEPQKTLNYDQSSGILVPLFDNDTNMCFLCGKGDRNIQFIEITDSDPFIVEGLKYSGEQSRGTCLVPKRAMNVMQGEVNRVLQLCESSIVPIMWQVPRKTYRDYHADIYPETVGMDAGMSPGSWWSGENCQPPLINLDPKKRPKENLVVFQEKLDGQPRRVERNGDAASKLVENGSAAAAVKEEEAAPPQEFNSPFVKPFPKPRVAAVVRSNSSCSTEAPRKKPTPIPTSSPKPNLYEGPTPRPRGLAYPHSPRGLVYSQSVCIKERTPAAANDVVDEGLQLLKRGPSIRDKQKFFEENLKRTQETTNYKKAPPAVVEPVSEKLPVIELEKPKPLGDEEDKENKSEKASPKDKEIKDLPRADGVELRKKDFALLTPDNREEDSIPKRPVSKFGRVSKFKHLKGDVILKGKFENLKNLSTTCPAECNYVHANADRIAVPQKGPGGKIAIFEARKAGRIPDGVTPALINTNTVMDFGFDPFDNARMAVACDDGRVRLWRVPEGGLVQQMNEPEEEFPAHGDKIQIMQFHPLAKDIMLTAAFDRSVSIWDLNDTRSPKLTLEGHNDQLYSAKFSDCGRYVATTCRDGKIRVFDPRANPSPLIEGGEIVPKKGARVLWVLNSTCLVVTAFSRQSVRQVSIYRASDLMLMNTLDLEVSPAILIPHYDEDSSTLFLTGKGEMTVNAYEISADHPHLFPLSPYKANGLHQGFAFLPKNVCNVRGVEFARAFRVTDNSKSGGTIEPVSFTVPRVKTAFFQSDLFPDTRVVWEPTMTAEEWLSGSNKAAALMSLKPADMSDLTSEPSSATSSNTPSRQNSFHVHAIPPTIAAGQQQQQFQGGSSSFARELAKKKENDIENSVSSLLGGTVSDDLEQDRMEGVEDKEWDDQDEV